VSMPLPILAQIRGYKRRNFLTIVAQDEEYDKVTQLVTELSENVEDIDSKRAFSYGVRMGSGQDDDPLIICFTSKHLLGNVSKYPGHYAIFHIDGTYKLLKNRFPVIAYGRSDSNGQLHLISVAICSSEVTDTYTHFYRLISLFRFLFFVFFLNWC